MFSAAIKSGAAGNPTDPKFNYVTMLLHGDGTNGAQNNTFVDSSTNNFTITRNGNTTQGTFTPYGSTWSNYFGGGSNYLNFPSNAAYGMGTGDFTIEAWLYPTAAWAGAGSYNPIFLVNGTGGLYFGQNSAGFGLRQSGTANIISYGTSPTLNTWTHVAIVRSGTTVTMYYNGTSVATATSSANFTSGTLTIANDGSYGIPAQYISNLRIVKGTAVYTSAFTPSTAPLTAISGTSLLTCQGNRFVDASTNAAAITVTGSPSVQRFSPFSPTTAYSTSVIGGSGYFDGSGDRLSSPTSTTIDLSTADFTTECWVYPTNLSATKSIFVYQNGDAQNTNYGYWLNIKTTGVVRFENFSGNSQIGFDSTVAINLNTWNHIAVTRTGTSATTYVNGVGTTGTVSATFNAPSGAILNIGDNYGASFGSSNPYVGYMTDLRIVKGTRVYTANFTPPTAPLTAITNTSLLLNYTNAGILDNAMMSDLETVGNAQISTSVKKYGTGSIAFDGTGDWLTSPYISGLNDLSGDFTIEFWIYFNSQASITDLLGTSNNQAYLGAGKSGWIVGYRTATGVCFSYQSNSSWVFDTAFGTSISTTTWTHIAIVRSGSTISCYKNGVASGTTITNSSNLVSNTYGVYVGTGAGNQTLQLNGYIDDLRITKGYARYTSNFTPPTAAFPNN